MFLHPSSDYDKIKLIRSQKVVSDVSCEAVPSTVTLMTSTKSMAVGRIDFEDGFQIAITDFISIYDKRKAPEFLEINGNQIRSTVQLEHTRAKDYMAKIICFSDTKLAYGNITVRVIDENVEWSKWRLDTAIYQFQVLESTIPHTFITKLSGPNICPTPKYATQSPIIRIDGLDGTVFLNRKLDYEKEKLLSAEVTFECGEFKSTSILEINVVNENDESPKFNTRDGEIFVVNENTIGPFARIEADDPDSDFVFEIATNSIFDIEPKTGLLSAKTKLDYEQNPIHGLRVTARDTAGNFDAINIMIKVKNLAEFPPTFPETGQFKKPVTISGQITKGDIVRFAAAQDSDISEIDEGPTKVEHFILTVVPNYLTKYFEISPLTGAIYGTLDYVIRKPVDVILKVGAINRKQLMAKPVEIRINLRNAIKKKQLLIEYCPVIIYNATAFPAKTCRIIDDNKSGSITTANGVVNINGFLIISNLEMSSFNILDNQVLIGTVKIVANVCETLPVFTDGSASITVHENATIGMVLVGISQRGYDYDNFRLVNGSDEPFLIDNFSGNVYLTGPLDQGCPNPEYLECGSPIV